MLSALDADLVGRDRRLPGLRVVLDTDALGAAVHQAFPAAGVTGVSPAYARYKPGVSCLVRADVHGKDGVWSLCAKAYAPDAPHLKRALSRHPGARAERAPVLLPNFAIVLRPFPFDDTLRALERLSDPGECLRMLRRTWASVPDTGATLRTLAYKPERRWAGALDVNQATVATFKFHAGTAHDRACRGAAAFRSRDRLLVAATLGHSERHRAIALEWIQGHPLLDHLDDTGAAQMARVGEALATLHAQTSTKLIPAERGRIPGALVALGRDLAFVWPAITRRAAELADRLAGCLMEDRSDMRPTHGDFYAKQVLVCGDQIAFLDMDDAAIDEAEIDLGNFIAHLELESLRGRLSRSQVARATDALLNGYGSVSGGSRLDRIRIHTAAALFRLLPRPFRSREQNWADQTEAILNRSECLARMDSGTTRRCGPNAARTSFDSTQGALGALADPALPMLKAALDPEAAERAFVDALGETVAVRRARVTRHKWGRRCLIEYDVETRDGAFTWIGKMRTRGCDHRAARVQSALERSGFGHDSASGVSVPPVIGCVTPLSLWLQKKVEGRRVTELLTQDGAASVAAAAVRAVRHLHRSDVAPSRMHGPDDELRVLDDRLSQVANLNPTWRRRLMHVMDDCRRQAARLVGRSMSHLHRDFYPDQVIVNHGRVFLIDLDTYAFGDAALDAGNFLAHVIEGGLRAPNGDGLLSDVNAAIVAGYRGGRSHWTEDQEALDFYTTVALARLVHVSTLLPERRAFTRRILEAVEARIQER